ncbi:uncharacterized protein CLAFUR5_09061 [Fulvia fulva]|uniref:Uncharacterized protein n=1 Tax=Passalora fulva TaxID=5499 RepID=A0A9Q8UTE6_PASFU|nr:uncharacterized protein CLAFUR5_09061 [Fulvia fulva]UJO21715.1 hypothetical protein CLAFUR5_09061 [Fulvia fulva]
MADTPAARPSQLPVPSAEITAQTSLISDSSDAITVKTESIVVERKPRLLATWWQEGISALLLVASATASFATLYPYQGKPLPDWPYSITVGSLLSAYSVVLRLSASFLLAEGLAQLKWQWMNRKERPLHDLVLHDDATRGPLGAIDLLRRLPFPWSWQWLACVLILVTLLIGPFTQQVLQYRQCSVVVQKSDNRQSLVPRASIFLGKGAHEGAGINILTMAEQASVNAGLYTAGQVRVTCFSGNCTIAPYKSIGYCSSCVDVSSEARVTTTNNTNGRLGYNGDITNTSLSSGLAVVHNRTKLASATYDLGTSAFAQGTFQILLGLAGTSGRPMDLASGRAPPCDDPDTKETWRCKGYGATNCSFYPCVRSYEAHIVNGAFAETVVDETPETADWNTTDSPIASYLAAMLDTSCLERSEREALAAAGFNFSSTSNWSPYPFFNGSDTQRRTNISNIGDLVDLERHYLDRGCVYGTNIFFINGLNMYLRMALTGNLSISAGSYGRYTLIEGSQLLQLVYNYGDASFERTQALMQNVSLSLSNYMRLNPGQDFYSSSMPATGEASEMKTCLQVQWIWLTLPMVVTILTLILFVATVVSARKVPRVVTTWKSSLLPLFFYGPDYQSRTPGMDVREMMTQDVTSMAKHAKTVRIRLETDEKESVRLREVHGVARPAEDR